MRPFVLVTRREAVSFHPAAKSSQRRERATGSGADRAKRRQARRFPVLKARTAARGIGEVGYIAQAARAAGSRVEGPDGGAGPRGARIQRESGARGGARVQPGGGADERVRVGELPV